MLDGSMIRRTSNRLSGWNYANVAAYFVTLVVRDRACLFGEISDGEMFLNSYGSVVDESWSWLQEQYEHVELDAYVVMPNHLHGIIVITDNQFGQPVSQRKPLGRLIGAFKTVSTKRVNELRSTPGESIWQRGFYDRVIRNEAELESVREYISGNPLKWDEDNENPANPLRGGS